jgi:hypothetical protein
LGEAAAQAIFDAQAEPGWFLFWHQLSIHG